MHEMSLCESIMEIVENEAQRQRFSKVNSVRLEIGALSGVEPDAMTFCFDAVSRGTIADGAKLELMHVPARAWCMDCAQDVIIQQRFDPCPICGNPLVQVKTGTEMKIKDMEVE
jgi:hydrogenase nickel incorporation protein HypA/HybF